MRRLLVLALALAATIITSARSTAAAPRYSGFSAHIDNPWFPLLPGTRYLYTGVTDGKPSRDILTVPRQTTTIAGAPCVVVHDRLHPRGRLARRPTDRHRHGSPRNADHSRQP